MDAHGGAIAVWERLAGDRSSIFSKRQDVSGNWGDPLPVERQDDANAFAPRVAVDMDGNAIAVWEQETSDSPSRIFANRYLVSDGSWQINPVPIDVEEAGRALQPQISVDADGDALAVWVQSEGDLAGVWGNRCAAGGDWDGPVPIGPLGLGEPRQPHLASNPAGEALAVWVQFDRVQESIWSNRYTPRRGWAKSESIEKDNDTRFGGPQVAIDFEGNAVAVWIGELADQTDTNLWSNRLTTPGSDTQ
jgi:hypothetical protein